MGEKKDIKPNIYEDTDISLLFNVHQGTEYEKQKMKISTD